MPETYLYSAHGLNSRPNLRLSLRVIRCRSRLRPMPSRLTRCGNRFSMTCGKRKRRILEAEPHQFGVFVEERDDFAGLGGQSALAGGQQIEMRQHDDAPLDRPAHRLAQLRDHGAHQAHRHTALGFALPARPAVEIEATQIDGTKTIADVGVEIGRQILVALDERGQSALDLGSDLGQFRSNTPLRRPVRP